MTANDNFTEATQSDLQVLERELDSISSRLAGVEQILRNASGRSSGVDDTLELMAQITADASERTSLVAARLRKSCVAE